LERSVLSTRVWGKPLSGHVLVPARGTVHTCVGEAACYN